MDRQAWLGFILIFVVLVIWMMTNTPPRQTVPSGGPDSTGLAADSVKPVKQPVRTAITQSKVRSDSLGRFFAGRPAGRERIISVETDYYKAQISTVGGLIKEWELRKFTTWNGYPVQLVDYEKKGDLSILFTTTDGKLINTRSLVFDTGNQDRIVLSGDQEAVLEMTLSTSNGGKLTKVFRFKNRTYGFDLELIFSGMESVIANFEYQLIWESGLRYAERNSVEESSFAFAHVFAAGEHLELDAAAVGERASKDHTGTIEWAATNTKYFVLAIIPGEGTSTGAYLEGNREAMPDQGVHETYSLAVKMPFKGRLEERETFKVYLGPSDYSLLAEYDRGLENIISLGWTWVVRPISVYVMLPLFSFLNTIIPNWGVVIIIFSIIIKIALHPLSKTSMKSMKKMQSLQPMMDEIREKHKDDPQKMNQQIMALYKEYGVNPAGGCLPLLLQFPILIALYNVFRSSIELRQANFVWWIQDLSIPDVIATLPFTIPLFGIQEMSGLALLMGITTFIQQKMTVKDPRQKSMVWMMPLMMWLLFNSFPSGLNLYYFVFNALSIGQQMYVNRQHDQEPLRKVESKKTNRGGVFKRFKDMPRLKR